MKYAYLIVLVALVACSGEGQMSSDIPSDMDYEAKARQFAEALVANKYEAAFGMLATSLQSEWSPAGLQSAFEEMTAYGEGNPRVDGYVHTMDDWPNKRPSDIGWTYVSISGDDYAEAGTVIVSLEDDAMKIREIEWGRP